MCRAENSDWKCVEVNYGKRLMREHMTAGFVLSRVGSDDRTQERLSDFMTLGPTIADSK
jgi:hypothetical protein